MRKRRGMCHERQWSRSFRVQALLSLLVAFLQILTGPVLFAMNDDPKRFNPKGTAFELLFEKALNPTDWEIGTKAADSLFASYSLDLDQMKALLKGKNPNVVHRTLRELEKSTDPETPDLLLEMLSRDGNFAAARTLGTRKEPRAIQPLLDALKRRAQSDSRWTISDALARYGYVLIAHRLVPLLKDSDPEVRYFAFRTLEKMEDARCLSLLIPGAQDASQKIRHLAVPYLGKSKKPEDLERLIAMAGSEPDIYLRSAALQALRGHISDQRAFQIFKAALLDPDREIFRVAQEALLSGNQTIVPSLFQEIWEHPSPFIRARVMNILGLRKEPECHQILYRALVSDSSALVRIAAAKAFQNEYWYNNGLDYHQLQTAADTDSDPGVRVAAIRVLSQRRTPDDLMALRKWAQAPIPEVKIAAIEELGKRIKPEADKVLLDLLRFPDLIMKRKSAAVLAAIPRAGLLDSLLAHLDNETDQETRVLLIEGLFADEVVAKMTAVLQKFRREENLGARIAWVHLLGRINTPEAQQAIVDTLRDQNPHIQNEAGIAMTTWKHFPASHSLALALSDSRPATRKEAVILCRNHGLKEFLPLVETMLAKDSEPDVRREAAITFGRQAPEDELPALEQAAVKDPDVSVRAAIVRALGERIGLKGQDLLVRFYQHDPEPLVQAAAVETLGYMDASETADIILQSFSTRASAVRRAIVKVVKSLAPKQATTFLSQIVRSDPDPEIRLAAAGSLFNAREPGVQKSALQALENNDPLVIKAVLGWFRLYRKPISPRYLGPILTHGDLSVREAAIEIAALATESAVASLLEARLASETDPRILEALGKTLGQLPQNIGEEALIRALKNSSPEVRSIGLLGLGATKDAKIIPYLIAAGSDSSPEVRRSSIWAMRSFYRPDVLRALAKALHDPDPETAKMAVLALYGANRLHAALEGVTPDPVVELLIEGLADEREEIRAEALQALQWRTSADPGPGLGAWQAWFDRIKKGTIPDEEQRKKEK